MRASTEEMQNLKKSIGGGFGGDSESNNTLFIEGLSKVTQTSYLNELFMNMQGFKEVRHVVEKQVAFVEFEDDGQAASAMQKLNGFAVKEQNGENTVLRISFAKR